MTWPEDLLLIGSYSCHISRTVPSVVYGSRATGATKPVSSSSRAHFLCQIVRIAVEQLVLAIKGEIVMSPELDKVS